MKFSTLLLFSVLLAQIGSTVVLLNATANKDSTGSKTTSKISHTAMKNLGNTDETHLNEVLVYLEEQRATTALGLEMLKRIEQRYDSMALEKRTDAEKAASSLGSYEPSSHYSQEDITDAVERAEYSVDQALAKGNWTRNDHAALAEVAHYLDKPSRDRLRNLILQAVNDQRLQLEEPLILPF